MPKLSIERRIQIHASLDKIHEIVSDFHHWQAWSPWLITEPEAKVEVKPDGKFYQWKGKRTGEGKMQVVEDNKNSIHYDLFFIKPWKSQAKVSFLLEEKEDFVLVTWTMDSSLPFFLFWMKTKTEAFIGMDYDRGLMMLKEYAEEGTVSSQLNFLGKEEFAGTNYIGIKTKCDFKNIGAEMERDFTKLHNWAEENNISITGVPFSIYNQFNAVKGTTNYTAAIPVNKIPNGLTANMFGGTLPKMPIETIQHIGKYDYLGNAWSAGMMMVRGKEFKTSKKIKPMEFYLNDSQEIQPKELVTNICFPTK